MVFNNFMEIQMGGGGGVFELGNPEGRGAQAGLEIQVEGGGTVPSVVGMWIFSGITQCTMPFVQKIVIDSYCHKFVMT